MPGLGGRGSGRLAAVACAMRFRGGENFSGLEGAMTRRAGALILSTLHDRVRHCLMGQCLPLSAITAGNF
jgi:hypothetical protein